MKKQSHEIDVQASASISQLRTQFKQNEIFITSISSSIKKKREQMKQFSQEMTKILQKKLIPKKQSIYKHPNFAPQFDNKKLQQLYDSKQSIYSQINCLKIKISNIISKQEPEVVEEIHKKQGIMQLLNKQHNEILKQKKMIEDTLQKNKEILQQYKQNKCIKQIQENEQQFTNIKYQIKELDQDIKNWANQQIKINIYQQKVNRHIQEMQKIKPQIQINQQEFQLLILQINQIIEQRKLLDRQHANKKQQVNRKIKQMLHLNSEIQKNIRQKTKITLKEQLDRKKQLILIKNKSMPVIKKSERISISRQKVNLPQKPKQQYSPSLLLTQPPERKKQKKNEKNQRITIGSWIPQNHIHDDIMQSRDIVRAVALRLKTKQKKITAIGASYIDKIGVQIMGKSNIWKLQQSKLQQDQKQYKIDLEDVESLYYYAPNQKQKGNGAQSTPIGLKFIMKSQKIQIKIGQFLNEQQIQCIEFDLNFIKAVQFTLDNSLKYISGIRITLGKSKEPNKNASFSDIQKQAADVVVKQQLKGGNEQIMPSKWLTTTSQAGITNKKVFLKSPGNKRNLNQTPQIDHRLLLNRKKKMV